MELEAVYFGENYIIKNKKLTSINEVDIEEIVLSHNKSYGKDSFKYFIGHRHKCHAFPTPLRVKPLR